ncbi:hypothetical protein [Sphingobacterium yanglingense]|uniref:Addiction module component n=1 Tax=Sphingobacterium yanglingense TaxID=1437280 RepID=A0A4R6WC22_9SPHI|nr:hypothetical protein [Sphingobacterium yanglingense]TDQ77079.1 hypothetical protein CLV99_2474 [Sphingobacterium yanglingense]
MATVIENEMLSYFTQLDESEKRSVVELLKTFLKSRKEDKTVTVEDYNLDLIEGEKEFERGEYITHEQLKNAI